MLTLQCGKACFQNIQAIFFDKDGTLADSQAFLQSLGRKRARLIDAQIPGVLERLLMAFGLSESRLNPAGLLAVGTRSENEIASAAYVAETGQDWIAALDIANSAFSEADKFFKHKAEHTPLFPGALDVLKLLAEQGIQIGIVSSDSTKNVHDFVECYNLQSLVKVAVGSEPGLSKPDPALLWSACDRIGVQVAHSLVIGDSAADVEMAIAAGAAGCVGVTWGWPTPFHLEKVDTLIHSFSEISVLTPS